MDSFIKKIFEGRIDNFVHLQLVKFSRGEFKDRALVNVNKSKDKFSIVTTYEYANDFVRSMADKLVDKEKTHVKGVIVSTRDLEGQMAFKGKKQFMGVKQYIIDDPLSKEEILNICNKFPTSFLGLSFEVNGSELKIKAKAPKSAKPSTGADKRPTPDFCRLKTNDPKLIKMILFDVGEFKKIEISHDLIITEIKIPKNETDPAKMRENAVRKGKLIRKIVIDGNPIKKEIEFEA